MKAIVQDRYGPPDVLHLEDIEEPITRADEVLGRLVGRSSSPSKGSCRRWLRSSGPAQAPGEHPSFHLVQAGYDGRIEADRQRRRAALPPGCKGDARRHLGLRELSSQPGELTQVASLTATWGPPA
jgi:hypothetical protein